MGRFLGEVKPLGKRWIWPFAEMEEGDWFLVDWTLRDPERVRHLASVRAAQLGIRLAVEKRPAEHPGFCKVERPAGEQPAPVRERVDFETIGFVISKSYGQDHAQYAWTMLDVGQEQRIEARQVEKPVASEFIVTIPDHWTFYVRLMPEGISMRRIPQGHTLSSWRMAQMEELMD